MLTWVPSHAGMPYEHRAHDGSMTLCWSLARRELDSLLTAVHCGLSRCCCCSSCVCCCWGQLLLLQWLRAAAVSTVVEGSCCCSWGQLLLLPLSAADPTVWERASACMLGLGVLGCCMCVRFVFLKSYAKNCEADLYPRPICYMNHFDT